MLQEVAPDIPIVDQDVIARIVVEVGQPAYQSIVKYFGPEVLLPDKTLNRKHLGSVRVSRFDFEASFASE